MGLEVTAMAGSGHHQYHSHHHMHTQQQHGAGSAHQATTAQGAAAPLGSASLPFVAPAQSSSESDAWRDESWIVDCPCGVTFDDGEEMVECDSCCVWVHTSCCRVPKGLSTYVCDKCKSKKKSEDEVVQLLVDFPNTARTGNTDVKANDKTLEASAGARVFTSPDVPIEQRVHVQGIPGGDANIFMGASKILRQLWQHSGYVPKTFQVEYDEFPDRGSTGNEACLFVLKSVAEKVDDIPLEIRSKPQQSNLGMEMVSAKYGDRCTQNLLFEVQSSKKDLEGGIETQKVDSVRQSKHKQRLRGAKEDRTHQHSKQGRDEGALKDQTSKKKVKNSLDICKFDIELFRKGCPTSAPQQLSPKNPKAMKKSAVQEFMDGDTMVCRKCGKLETLFCAESIDKGVVAYDNMKSLLCKDCEHSSNSNADELHAQAILVSKNLEKVQSVAFPLVADSTNVFNKSEVADAKLQDVKDAIDQCEASSVGDKRRKGYQDKFEPASEGLAGELHLPGDNAYMEEKDNKPDVKINKLEGQQPFFKSMESVWPSTVLNTQVSFTGASFEEETNPVPLLPKASDFLAESIDSKLFARAASEIPLHDSSSQCKSQVEHKVSVPISTIASSNVLPDSQLEDVLQQPSSSGITLGSEVDGKQGSLSTSRIIKDINEGSSKMSGQKTSSKEHPSQQPQTSGISAQHQVEPPQPHDPLRAQTIEGSSKQLCGKSIHSSLQQVSDKHSQEALAGRSPHTCITEAGQQLSKDDQNVVSPRECKPSFERHVPSYLDSKETISSSPLQSPKVQGQKSTKLAPGSKSSAFPTVPKLPSLSGAKSSAASSVSPGITKNSSATKQPIRVGSPPSRKPDTLSLSLKSSSGVSPGGNTPSAHLSRDGMKSSGNVAGKASSIRKTVSQVQVSKLPVSISKAAQSPSISRSSGFQPLGKKLSPNLSSKSTVVGSLKFKSGQVNKEESLVNCSKDDKRNLSSTLHSTKKVPSLAPPPPPVTIPHPNATAQTSSAVLNDEELALLLHQELNSSPRVPRVPRVRQIVTSPQQILSNQPVSGVVKSAFSATPSSSGSKDNRAAWRKRIRDERHKDESSHSFVGDESNKKCEPTSSATPNKKEEEGSVTAGEVALAQTREEASILAVAGPPQQAASVSFARHSPTIESAHGERKNSAEISPTLSGLICEILSSKETQLSFEDICTATLPHWQKLQKSNSELCAHSSHRQTVFDCLRNNTRWAHLVDQAPKASSKRKHRNDSSSTTEVESEEDADLGSSYTHELLEFQRPGKLSRIHEGEKSTIDKQKDHENLLPKGKRKARRRRKLAIEDETEDDDDYIEKVRKPPHIQVLPGKPGGGQAEEQDAPSSLSEAASSHPSENEEEEIVVHRSARRIRKRIEEGEDDADF